MNLNEIMSSIKKSFDEFSKNKNITNFLEIVGNHKLISFLLLICVFILSVLIIDLPYKIGVTFPIYKTNISVGDLLGFFGAFLSFIGTIALGGIAIMQNEKLIDVEKKIFHPVLQLENCDDVYLKFNEIENSYEEGNFEYTIYLINGYASNYNSKINAIYFDEKQIEDIFKDRTISECKNKVEIDGQVSFISEYMKINENSLKENIELNSISPEHIKTNKSCIIELHFLCKNIYKEPHINIFYLGFQIIEHYDTYVLEYKGNILD